MDIDDYHHGGFGQLNMPLFLRPTQRSERPTDTLDFSMTRSSLVAGNNKRDSLYLPPKNFIGRKVLKKPNMAPDRLWKPQSGGLAGPYAFPGPVMEGYGIPVETFQ